MKPRSFVTMRKFGLGGFFCLVALSALPSASDADDCTPEPADFDFYVTDCDDDPMTSCGIKLELYRGLEEIWENPSVAPSLNGHVSEYIEECCCCDILHVTITTVWDDPFVVMFKRNCEGNGCEASVKNWVQVYNFEEDCGGIENCCVDDEGDEFHIRYNPE